MLINAQSLDLAYRGFKTVFTEAFDGAPKHKDRIAMTVPSASRDETYGWLGMFPQMREWVGPRHVMSLKAKAFTIANRKFEATLRVERDDIADDKLGLHKPMFAEMGRNAAEHPEELLFGLLGSGFETECYDGQNFFDTDHPVELASGEVLSVSNVQAGSGPAWFLLDATRAVRPIIWQEREPYDFQQIVNDDQQYVFINDAYLYGVRARVNAGFGLWQLAFGSKADLTAANYAAARAQMMTAKVDGGRVLGVRPSLLVVPPTLEEDALKIVNTENGTGGETNPWKGTAELIVTPYLG